MSMWLYNITRKVIYNDIPITILLQLLTFVPRIRRTLLDIKSKCFRKKHIIKMYSNIKK